MILLSHHSMHTNAQFNASRCMHGCLHLYRHTSALGTQVLRCRRQDVVFLKFLSFPFHSALWSEITFLSCNWSSVLCFIQCIPMHARLFASVQTHKCTRYTGVKMSSSRRCVFKVPLLSIPFRAVIRDYIPLLQLEQRAVFWCSLKWHSQCIVILLVTTAAFITFPQGSTLGLFMFQFSSNDLTFVSWLVL